MELLQGWLLRATPARLGLLGPRSRLGTHHIGSDLRLELGARPARRLREITRDRGRSYEIGGGRARSWERTRDRGSSQRCRRAVLRRRWCGDRCSAEGGKRGDTCREAATTAFAASDTPECAATEERHWQGAARGAPCGFLRPALDGQRGGVASAGQPLPPPRRVLLERPTGGAAPPLARVRHRRASEIFLGLQGMSSRLARCF